MRPAILESRDFSRERVKNRMLRRAAELWGYAETDLDAFDPLVALLIEACSVEFERISGEIADTQNRLIDRLAQLLNPAIDVAKPAFGVAQARPVEPRTEVYPHTQLQVKRGTGSVGDVFFSPVSTTTLVDGAVRYIAGGGTLFRLEEGTQKIPVSFANSPAVLPYQSVWLGVELAEQVPSLEGVSFFIDWPNQTERTNWYQYLPFGQWLMAGQELKATVGLAGGAELADGVSALESEFNPVYNLEKQVLALWNNAFVTIQEAPAFRQLGNQRQLFPPVFTDWFSERDLRSLKEPLWWIEVRLPHNLPPEALSGVFCTINAFPTLNRRLHKLTYRLQQNLNIIPLQTERSFLAMKEVRTNQKTQLKSIPLGNLLELDANTYTLQYGVNRFDDRNARTVLTNLQDLIRDESASFTALGEDFLGSVIRELNQTIARLEAKVAQKTQKGDPAPYLVIKPKQAGETVFIEYWTCDGEAANRIPAGSRLTPYADASLRKECSFLLTTTSGGRERMKESEKINQYKRALLTRNRVVTLEDVRIACLAELGRSVRTVTVEKAFLVSSSPTAGFQRCVRVVLTPSANSGYTPAEWQQRCEQLRISLDAQSVSNLPYQVVMAGL